jgi:predicted alpha/beta hydrolase family esterase
MKRAVILHGTNASPEKNWFPWLKKYLEQRGYQVWVPLLPNNDVPNRFTYNDFLFNSDWDFTDNLVIGHSSGAVSVLNLISDNRCPKISTAVMVGVWTDNAGTHL